MSEYVSDEDMTGMRREIAAVTESAIVEGFVLIATTIGSDAEQSVSIVSDFDHGWQVLGLLAHATETTKHMKYHEGDDQ